MLKSTYHRAVLLVLALPLLAAADPLDANRRGLAMLERSLEAHGGPQDDLAATLSLRSDFVNEQQSLVGVAPFETYPVRFDVKIEQATRRVRLASTQMLPGDFHFRDVTITTQGKGFALNTDLKTWREAGESPLLNRAFPHRIVGQALAARTSVRATSEHAVTFATPNGQLVALEFDPKSSLLVRVDQLMPMSPYGDTRREVLYDGYRRTGKLLLPSTMTIRTTNAVHGTLSNVYRYEDVVNAAAFADGELAVPEGYAKEDYSSRPKFGAKTLAPGVHLLENLTSTDGQWSYNVLAVEFSDHVLIAEAPLSSATSEQVLAKVREIAPGKPVRYLVQSHHHGDHIGGIRSYIAEGATLVVGASARPLIEKVAKAPFRLDPDRLHREPRDPKFDIVKGSRTLRDATREVTIINIGPAPHAEDMLFVWLPNERILYQADLINDGEYPDNEGTKHFLAKLRELGIQPKWIAGLHGRVRAFGFEN